MGLLLDHFSIWNIAVKSSVHNGMRAELVLMEYAALLIEGELMMLSLWESRIHVDE
jgi:hypothetical protein